MMNSAITIMVRTTAMGFAKRSTHPAICCPTGKSPGQFTAPRVQPLLQKYSDFPKTQIGLYPLPSRPTEGRFAIVTDAGRDAVDARSARDESAFLRTEKSCGPDTPTLVSSSRKATFAGDGGKKARSPGRARRKPLKPLRGECRVFPV